jgi:hypothetical protein
MEVSVDYSHSNLAASQQDISRLVTGNPHTNGSPQFATQSAYHPTVSYSSDDQAHNIEPS